jgi:hypothetical protein
VRIICLWSDFAFGASLKLTVDFNPHLVSRDQVLLVATDWHGYFHVLEQLDAEADVIAALTITNCWR